MDRSTAAVAALFVVSWWTAWRAIAAAATAKLAARPSRPPSKLGVDETRFRCPGRFMTGIVKLSTAKLWDLFEGRSKAVLADRLPLLGDDVVEIESVVIDLYARCKAAVREPPHAVGVADRFHIEASPPKPSPMSELDANDRSVATEAVKVTRSTRCTESRCSGLMFPRFAAPRNATTANSWACVP